MLKNIKNTLFGYWIIPLSFKLSNRIEKSPLEQKYKELFKLRRIMAHPKSVKNHRNFSAPLKLFKHTFILDIKKAD